MDSKGLFRAAALEKLSSPERLDVMMQVTSPAAWLALLALGAIIAVMVVWSVVGTIAIKVQGKGILIRGEAVLEVTSGTEGRVTEITVKENETVRQGDLVARVLQPQLDERLRSKRAELEGLIFQGGAQRADQSAIIARLQSQADELRQKIAHQEEAVAKGLLTTGTLLTTKQQLTQTEQQMVQIRSGFGEHQIRADAVRREIRELESQRGSTTEVRSAFTGRVIELAANVGDLLSPGSPVVTLEAFEEPIAGVIYIPAADGKKVQPGMKAQISPSTVKAEEYGFILAEVKSVSDYPVTPEALRKVLRNEQLVADLAGKAAPMEVVVALSEDPATTSGFKWSSSNGPPMKVFSGTICNARVTVSKKRPISYVIPLFKSTLGIG